MRIIRRVSGLIYGGLLYLPDGPIRPLALTVDGETGSVILSVETTDSLASVTYQTLFLADGNSVEESATYAGWFMHDHDWGQTFVYLQRVKA